MIWFNSVNIGGVIQVLILLSQKNLIQNIEMNMVMNRYMNIEFDVFIYFVVIKMIITPNSSEIFLQKMESLLNKDY